MAGNCEISNILTNVMNTMYHSDDGQSVSPEIPPTNTREIIQPLSIVQLPMDITGQTNWCSVPPQLWSKQHVLEWISYHIEKNKYDASTINFSFCDMDGTTLCQLACKDLVAIFGPLGEQLHQHLRDPSTKPANCIFFLSETLPVQSESTETPIPNSLGSSNAGEFTEQARSSITYPAPCTSGCPAALHNKAISTDSLRSYSPNSPDSGGSEFDYDHIEAKHPAINGKQTEEGDVKPQKRGRGRPRKLNKDGRNCLDTKKKIHSSRGTHLWEFIRDILIHPELNNGLMKWEDQSEGVFKFLKSEAVAQLWGQKKKNSSMTYEKLSRAMRYYYKRDILERVDGRRLVYKFGKNSSGWKVGEVSLN
uniref:E74 like ETS transcription factor 3 n=1 Tax=Latimeria chalumnae TaxID=7897 RepID=H3B3L6_LATCH